MIKACALFDKWEKFVTGTKRRLALRLRDQTFARTPALGITTKAQLVVKPGEYLVRVVVQGEEGKPPASDSPIDAR